MNLFNFHHSLYRADSFFVGIGSLTIVYSLIAMTYLAVIQYSAKRQFGQKSNRIWEKVSFVMLILVCLIFELTTIFNPLKSLTVWPVDIFQKAIGKPAKHLGE